MLVVLRRAPLCSASLSPFNLFVVMQGDTMSGRTEDKNPVIDTVEKVREAGAVAAEKAKETAAHLQPDGSQVGDVVQEKSDGSAEKVKEPE